MEDQYGMADLRHYINGRPLFHSIPQPPDLLSSHRGLSSAAAPHPYDMLIFRSDSAAATNTNAGFAASSSGAAGQCFNGFENGPSGGDGGAGRWPRQETLTLLEIRSRLDPKFKEANQKGPLWDEVSRIMSEEHGYQRGGKKCREKFENLYKYYKKTKEGKAGRQDGKHYRFFRQLEALYGEANSSVSMSEAHLAGGAAYHSNFSYKSQLLAQNHEPSQGAKLSDTSLSLSNYSEADTTSSEDSDELGINNQCGKIKKRSGWKMKIKDFIDARMKKLMEKQEAWMEKMMRTIEDKERERRMREDEWRKQDAMRIEREHKFWASEREWIEAQNNALMDALHKLTGTAPPPQEAAAAAEIRSLSENIHNDDVDGSETTAKGGDVWPECEINTLIQMRTAVGGVAEEIAWEEVSTKMACFGYERSAAVCKEKWDSVNNYAIKCSKKRKEDSKSCTYFHSHDSISNQGRGGGGGGGGVYSDHTNEQGNADHHHHHHHNISPNQNGAEAISESCFRYFMGDAY